jgi:hypothetical protein
VYHQPDIYIIWYIFIYNEIYKYNSQSHVCCFHLLVRAHLISLDRQVRTIKINVCLVFVLCRMLWLVFRNFCALYVWVFIICTLNVYIIIIYIHNYHACFFLLSLSLLLPFSLHFMVHILFWWSNPELWWGCWDPSVHRPPSAAKTTIFCWLNSIKHEFRVVVLKWGIPKTMGFNEFRMIWGPWRMFCSKRGPPVINWWIRPSANMLYLP